MTTKIIELRENWAEFIITTRPEVANAIRRYIMNHVPVYAIDKIFVYENSSSFFDEYIAHRIGMIPIKVKKEIDPEKVAFYLDVKGPKVVMSQDLIPTSDVIEVAVKDIPIIHLLEGQALRIECRLAKNIGRKHAKFQSGIVSYEEQDGKYLFFVETLYHMDARTLIDRAFEELDKDLGVLEQLIE